MALRRLGWSTAAALIAGTLVVSVGGSWPVAVSVAWDGAAAVVLVSIALLIGKDEEATEQAARVEDASRAAADTLLLSASVASLVAVAFVLVEAAHRTGLAKEALVALAVASVVGAWLSVHSVYMLRSARLYYADPVGGIDFHSGEAPEYRDFVYVALTIGMTFQVSDTDLNAKSVRHAAVQHALLPDIFGGHRRHHDQHRWQSRKRSARLNRKPRWARHRRFSPPTCTEHRRGPSEVTAPAMAAPTRGSELLRLRSQSGLHRQNARAAGRPPPRSAPHH